MSKRWFYAQISSDFYVDKHRAIIEFTQDGEPLKKFFTASNQCPECIGPQKKCPLCVIIEKNFHDPLIYLIDSSTLVTNLAVTKSSVVPQGIRDVIDKHELHNRLPYPELERKLKEIMKATIPLKPSTPVVPHKQLSIHIPPQPDGFFLPPEMWKMLVFMASRKKQVLLTGPSGCGKTETVDHVAKAMQYSVERFNFGGITDAKSGVIGTTQYHPEKGTFFVESLFLKAIKKPKTIVLLDEITRASPEVFNLILTLLDRQKYIAVEDNVPPIKVDVHEDVIFWATANEGSQYTGTMAMDLALKDRFQAVMCVTFPKPDIEAKILANRAPGLHEKLISSAVNVASDQRAAYNQAKFNQHISTRALIEVAQSAAEGLGLREAFLLHVADRFSRDGEQQSEYTLFTQILDKNNVK